MFESFMKKKKRKARDAPDYATLWLSDREDLAVGYVSLANQSDVLQCVDKIADPVSNMTIKLMENGENGDFRVRDELSKMIDISPCRFMNRKNFIYRIASDLCRFGNAVAIPEFDGTFLRNLELVPAVQCSYRAKPDGAGYFINIGGKSYDAETVLHFVLIPDENEPFRGVGYAPLIKETVNSLVQADTTKQGFLKSKWKPSLIISVNSDVAELMQSEDRKRILNSYANETDRGEPWLIPAGELDIKTIQPLTLNDLAIQDSITLDKKVLASAIGVPPFMVGVGDYNKESYNNFIGTKIMSIAHIIEQELTKKLLLSPKRYFVFSPKSLMQYSLSEQVGYVKEMVAGGMLTRNEGRAEMGYTPVDNEGMNDYIVLENYVPVDRVGDQKKLNKKGGAENESENEPSGK